MIDAQTWVPAALDRLREAFGPRLLYLGLQGSYRRGEATETSDIDIVTLLDTFSLEDLDAYRSVVHALPEGEKACGFLCGAPELYHWPRHELFPFKMDTEDWYGSLDAFLPPISREDICAGARIGVSGLTHLLTHSYLYAAAEARPAILKDAYKAAFFSLQVVAYLESGAYHTSKKSLLASLEGSEMEILAAGLDFPGWLSAHSEQEGFVLLLDWCRRALMRI